MKKSRKFIITGSICITMVPLFKLATPFIKVNCNLVEY